MKHMVINHNCHTYKSDQPHIDPPIWSIVPSAGVPNASEEVGAAVMGCIVASVDDFAVISDDPVAELVTQAIVKKWRITDKPAIKAGSGDTVEYLSVEVAAVPGGWALSQQTYLNDLMTKWST